jgi:hypothetical protein
LSWCWNCQKLVPIVEEVRNASMPKTKNYSPTSLEKWQSHVCPNPHGQKLVNRAGSSIQNRHRRKGDTHAGGINKDAAR